MNAEMIDYKALAIACAKLMKNSEKFGIFSSAAVSSMVGNRNIAFKALYSDNSVISTVEANGFLLVDVGKNEGTRKNFDKYYLSCFGENPLNARKLLAYWLTWLCDASGMQVCLIASLAQEFLLAGIEPPVKVVKYTVIRHKDKADRTVKQVFGLDTLRLEVAAIVGDADNPGMLAAVESWVKNSPCRSKKYGLSDILDAADETVTIAPVIAIQLDEIGLKEFEL